MSNAAERGSLTWDGRVSILGRMESGGEAHLRTGDDHRSRAVILAAGRGVRLKPVTDRIPKPLVPVGGVSILQRQVVLLERLGVREVMVVTGYRAESIEAAVGRLASGIRFCFRHNPDWETTNNAVSLALASGFLALGGYVLEGDGIFRPSVSLPIGECAASQGCDLLWVVTRLDEPVDGCVLEADDDLRLTGIRIVRSADLQPGRPFLKSAGLLLLGPRGAAQLFALLRAHGAAYRTKYYDLLISDHLGSWDARVCPIGRDDWTEVDTAEDLRLAEERFA